MEIKTTSKHEVQMIPDSNGLPCDSSIWQWWKGDTGSAETFIWVWSAHLFLASCAGEAGQWQWPQPSVSPRVFKDTISFAQCVDQGLPMMCFGLILVFFNLQWVYQNITVSWDAGHLDKRASKISQKMQTTFPLYSFLFFFKSSCPERPGTKAVLYMLTTQSLLQ